MLEREWLRRGALAWLLSPLSIAFAVVTAARRALYRAGLLKSQRFDRPIIVVGNVIAGGSGKTPVVMAIARHLERRGLKVGVVSRGYGRTTSDCREVHRNSDPAEVGDEPLLIRRSTSAPVFVARKRVQAVDALLSAYPATRIVVCDDGLQHLALSRDIEICVFDDRGIGNGWLLPAGPLRERWPRRCDLILHTGKKPAFEGFTSRRSLSDHAVGQDGERVALAALAGLPVIAVAAIASPGSFFDMLRECGVAPAHCIALPDHHDFRDWKRPTDRSYRVLCTEKDAAKLWRFEPHALAVPLVFEPAPEFFRTLDAKLSSLDGLKAS